MQSRLSKKDLRLNLVSRPSFRKRNESVEPSSPSKELIDEVK